MIGGHDTLQDFGSGRCIGGHGINRKLFGEGTVTMDVTADVSEATPAASIGLAAGTKNFWQVEQIGAVQSGLFSCASGLLTPHGAVVAPSRRDGFCKRLGPAWREQLGAWRSPALSMGRRR